MTPHPIDGLFDELGERRGIYLFADDIARLKSSLPADADAFTNAIFVAEGFADSPGWRFHPMWKEVRSMVASRFAVLRLDSPPEG